MIYNRKYSRFLLTSGLSRYYYGVIKFNTTSVSFSISVCGGNQVNSKRLLEELSTLLTTEQINTNADELYDAAADRYKKYAKARKALDVPSPVAIV